MVIFIKIFFISKLNLTIQILRDLDFPIPVCNAFDGLIEYM